MPTRNDLVSASLLHEGEPYLASGAQVCGMNCLGAFVLWLREAGLTALADEAEPFVNYRRPIEPGDMLRRLYASKHLDLVRPKKLRAGNMILVKFGDEPQHVALITTSRPYTSVIHACGRVGKVLEQNMPPEWLISAEFRFLGLSDS